MAKCGVYKITSPSGKIYIGSSKNIEKRFKSYKSLKCDRQTRLYNSFKKYGVDSHLFEIIAECEQQERLRIEREFGIKLNVLGNTGLNCSIPKYNELPQLYSECTKERMRNSDNKGRFLKGNKPHNAGVKCTPEQVEKLINYRIGAKISDSQKEVLRKTWLGKKHKESSKEKVRQAKLGIPRSEETKRKLSEKNKGCPPPPSMTKSVDVFTIDGIYISSFNTMSDAAKKFGILRTSIGNNFNGLTSSVKTNMGKVVFKPKMNII